ncbi:hypothetical protein [Ahrensia sp. R2A130]|uniref:hypothetical protein n=1 Tax=Ahrensia sp. R2A130 TaxID=744979 RepID=UPI0001E0F03D|nr:hypothetical protein [Ahrensia sp. R2A130]EFL90947.1 hypothetical protein R2A130_2615 [Ahrensia sp. R2A130]
MKNVNKNTARNTKLSIGDVAQKSPVTYGSVLPNLGNGLYRSTVMPDGVGAVTSIADTDADSAAATRNAPEQSNCTTNLRDNACASLNASFDDYPDDGMGPPPITIDCADLRADEIAHRLGGTLIAERLHGKITSALQAQGLDTEFGADDRRYLSAAGLVRNYVTTMASAIVQASVDRDLPMDPVLGAASDFASTAFAIPKRCGPVLSDTMAGAIDTHPDMIVLTEVPIPVPQRAIATAKRHLKAGKGDKVKPQSYSPEEFAKARVRNVDIIAIDRRTGHVMAIESKRGQGPSDHGQASRTSTRLKGIELSLASWLDWNNILDVTCVTAIVADHYGKSGFRFGLQVSGGTFDEALGVRGVDEIMRELEDCLTERTAHGLWPVLLETLTAFMESGFAGQPDTAIDDHTARLLLSSVVKFRSGNIMMLELLRNALDVSRGENQRS